MSTITPDDFFDFGARTWGAKEATTKPPLDRSVFRARPSVLFFDTETAGLHQPAVLQLSYLYVPSHEGDEVVAYDRILRLPEGVRVSSGATKIHGITQEQCDNGGDPREALGDFVALCERVICNGGVVVAHNASFDARAVTWTLAQLGCPETLDARSVMCTMRSSKSHSPLLNVRGARKPFRLEELYTHLFGSPPAWARLHDAADDTWVLALCYQEGARRLWW